MRRVRPRPALADGSGRPAYCARAHGSGEGYWLVASDGGLFSFGDARFFGSMGGKPTDRPVVGMAATPEGDGYWLASEDGQVFAFGVLERGSAAEADNEQPEARTVGISAHPGGEGYWLVHGAIGVVEIRASGPDVAGLQRRLRDLGHWVGPVDGVFGKLLEGRLSGEHPRGP